VRFDILNGTELAALPRAIAGAREIG